MDRKIRKEHMESIVMTKPGIPITVGDYIPFRVDSRGLIEWIPSGSNNTAIGNGCTSTPKKKETFREQRARLRKEKIERPLSKKPWWRFWC